MKTKINYRWTAKEDKGQPNNGYSEETEYIIVGEDYSFSDYLDDSGLIGKYEQDGNPHYLIDEDGERTGEAYQIINTERGMLKSYRKAAGMTQKGLADLIGISIKTLQDYESGRKNINTASASTVKKIAEALGCRMEELIQ